MSTRNTEEKVSLDLNEEVRLFIRKRLRAFASKYPKSKFNIICWIDDLKIDVAKEIDDYLAENDCPKRLKIGGQIIGKCRASFDFITKKEKL